MIFYIVMLAIESFCSLTIKRGIIYWMFSNRVTDKEFTPAGWTIALSFFIMLIARLMS
jgi:hypothetical protein